MKEQLLLQQKAYNAELAKTASLELATATAETTRENALEILNAEVAESLIASMAKNKVDGETILTNIGLSKAENGTWIAENKLNAERVESIILASSLDEETKELVLSTLAYNSAVKQNTIAEAGNNAQDAVSGFAKLTTGIKGLSAAFMALPTPLKIGLVVAAIGTAIVTSLAISEKKTEEQLKKIQENYDEAKNTIDELNSTLEKQKSTVEEVSREYAKLAQGVNQVDGSNVNLSTEEYERFLELSNQLSEVFPTLTKNYDENGNAILDLSGNVDTITGSLYEFLNVQQQIANQKIIEQMPKMYDGFRENIKSLNTEIKDLYKTYGSYNSDGKFISDLDAIKDAGYEFGRHSGNHYHSYSKNGNGYSLGGLRDLLNKYGVKHNVEATYGTTIYGSVLNGYKVLYDEDELLRNYNTTISAIISQISKTKAELEAEMSEFNQYVNTWLQTDFAYSQVDNPSLQKAVSQMFADFNWSILPENIKKGNWEDVSEYLRNQITWVVNDLENGTDELSVNASKALQDLFMNPKNISLSQIDKYIETITQKLGSEHYITLYLKGEFQSEERTAMENKVKTFLSDTDESMLNTLSLKDLEIAQALSIDEGDILSWDELKQKIQEVKDVLNVPVVRSISELLASEEVSKEIDDYQALLNKVKDNASKDLTNEEKLDVMQEYADKIDWEKLGINTTSSTKDFNKALQDLAASGYQELIDKYPELKETLEGLGKDLLHLIDISSSLSSMKSSAELLFSVDENIRSNAKLSVSVLQEIISTYPEMEEAVYKYCTGLMKEEEIFGELEKLYQQEVQVYHDSLYTKLVTTNDYIMNLGTLYSQDFVNWKSLETAKLESEMELINSLSDKWSEYYNLVKGEDGNYYVQHTGDWSIFDSNDYQNDSNLLLDLEQHGAYLETKAKQYNELIKSLNAISFESVNIDTDWKSLGYGSSSADPWKEEFNTYFATLKHMLEMDEITQAQYYATLDSLNQKYFANREEYLDEYRQYEEEVYKGLRGLQSDAISDIEALRDMTIDMIKQTMEAEIEALEEKREKFNEEIEARKEIIELMKDEADHEEELNEKNKAVTDIQLQLDALKYDNSAAAQKKRRELEEDLADAQKELSDYISDYEYEQEIERLDKEAEAYDEKTQAEIDEIQELLDNEEYLIKEANRMMQEESDTLYEKLISWNKEFGSTIDADVRDKWEKAQTALGNFKGELETVAEIYERLRDAEIDKELTDSNIMKQIVNVPGKTGTNSGSNTNGSGSGSNSDKKPTSNTSSSSSDRPREYTVQKGDSLWSIARDYYGQGREWEKIRNANNIAEGGSIYPGQKLIIPFKTGGYTGNDEGLAYLHQKELVLNERQTQPVLDALPKLANVLPNLQELIDMGSYLVQKSFNPISTPAFAGIQPQNIISIGDININGNMGELTVTDLNKFRKDIVNDVFTSINKSRLKSGR